jgi:diguanylate cyclase (GGDEF)-like protein/PAS domain S-box-containing protein
LVAARLERADRERRRAQDATARLAAIVESCDDAIITLSPGGVIETWNAAAEHLFGYTAEEVIGQPREMLWPAGCKGTRLDDALAGDTIRVEGRAMRRDGSSVDVGATVSPVRGGEVIVGVSCVVRDITERKRIKCELERLAAAAQHGTDAVVSIDLDGRICHWNPGAVRLYRWSASEAVGRQLDELLTVCSDEPRDEIARMLAGEGAYQFETQRRRKDAAIIDVVLTISSWTVEGSVVGVTSVAIDVSEQRARERESERLAAAAEYGTDAVISIDLDGLVRHWNYGAERLYGFAAGEAIGRRVYELTRFTDGPQEVQARVEDAIARMLGGEAVRQVETQSRGKDGVIIDVLYTLTPWHRDGRVVGVTTVATDLTDRKRYETQLQFMADHDPLTGLQNRRRFGAELDRHVEHVKRYEPVGALVVLDIDHFKSVNDTLGHNAGDELIISIAGMLRGRVRTSDVLARLGGDEFAVLLPKADEAEAAQVAEALVQAVRSNTALLGGERKKVTTSIGVAMFNTNVEELTGETVVIEADLAMYDAKEAGGDGHAFYATSERRVSGTKARLTWVSRIEQALEEDRFALLAQPILDLHTGEVRQHELLVRMLDEHDDLIPPATFLYIAEHFGLIAKLDEWVATHAIELIGQRPELQLEVNISGRSLGDRKLLRAIDDRLRASSIDPARLIFEVTETAAVANITDAQAFAHHLRDRGCRFALDDFGAGFGSFYYLKHLPFDYVKIDGEFIQHATGGPIDQLVIEAIVGIARGLDKRTIAEFVADEKTQRMVTRLGVDYAQGYHIGKPVPVAELLDSTSPHRSSR